MFRAYDAGRERLVAVKLFKLDLPPERVHQLVAALEQLIAADLTHPALAAPLAAGITGVSAYLAQDYVAAESLDLAVREYGPAPPADALRVAAQLAGALDFASVEHVSHGALHPRDILLSADETRLTGIGIVRALEGVGVTAPVRRPYTAPERLAGREWDRRADTFSLAALVHELLWGRRIAGSGLHVADGLTDVAGGRLTALKDVFARALAEDPGDRFATALEFADALTQAFPDVSVNAPAPAPRRTAPSRTRVPGPRLPLDEEPKAPPAVIAPERADVPFRETAEEDLDLRAAALEAAEPARFREVDVTPSIPEALLAPRAAAINPDVVSTEDVHAHGSPAVSMIEQSRSAVWPLTAALAIGLAIGFAGGYGVGTREPTGAVSPPPATAPPSETAVVASPPSPPREATDVAVAPPKQPASAAPAVAPPPAPPPAARPSSGSRRTAEPRRATQPRAPDRQGPPVRPATAAAAGTTGRFAGRLSVESKPSPARVFVDGKFVGTTPLAIESVAVGSHVIRIEREGYRRWSSSVRVVANERNRVTASLER